jgi:hypothetical protein
MKAHFPEEWVRRTGNADFPPRSPDLTPQHLYFNAGYTSKQGTVEEVKREVFTSELIVIVMGLFFNSCE